MNTPTPRTDAVYLQRGNWANEEELRDLARKLETDLATERARLDWLMAGGVCLVQHSGGFHVCRLHCQVSRAAIDLGMKEDAK